MPALPRVDARVLEECFKDQERQPQKRVVKTTFFELPLVRAMMASDEVFAQGLREAVTSGNRSEVTLTLGDIAVDYDTTDMLFENQCLRFHITEENCIEINAVDDIDLYPDADFVSYDFISHSDNKAEHAFLRKKKGSLLRDVWELPRDLQAFGNFTIVSIDDEEEGYTQCKLFLTA